MHVSCRRIAVLARINEKDVSPYTRQPTQSTEASRTTTNDDGVPLALGTMLIWLGHSCAENLRRQWQEEERLEDPSVGGERECERRRKDTTETGCDAHDYLNSENQNQKAAIYSIFISMAQSNPSPYVQGIAWDADPHSHGSHLTSASTPAGTHRLHVLESSSADMGPRQVQTHRTILSRNGVRYVDGFGVEEYDSPMMEER